MWNRLANFKDNLSQMASEVLETVEELDPAAPREEDNEESPGSSRSQQAGRGFHRRRGSADGFQNFEHRPWRHREERNGGAAAADYEALLIESQRKCQELAKREKEVIDQAREKEEEFRDLDRVHRDALIELERVKAELEQARLDLVTSSQQVKSDDHDSANHDSGVDPAADSDLERLRSEVEERDETIRQLRESVSMLQAEREDLKNTLDSRELELHQRADSGEKSSVDVQNEVLRLQAKQADVLSDQLRKAEETFETERSEFKKKLEALTLEKDKALSNLSRLRQHLLEKENADSEKMDRDSEQIVVLEAKLATASTRVIQLEQALSQALSSQTDVSKRLNEELQASKLEVESVNSKLASSYSALEAKNSEIANLQVALGQYYAECDAKERLQRELNAAKEDLRKLSDNFEAAKRMIESLEAQKKEAADRLVAEERKGVENQQKSQKLQEDMIRLRRALEESMIRLNRMSSDSDYSVDRRIVIKLLVTYFERGHNREVLDLMARMLGFSDDEKRRVGLAQQNSNKPGVVRSVFGLPGRVVGGMLSGSSESRSFSGNNQSFADLWIDFLLKESEERERAQNSISQNDSSSSMNSELEVDGSFESSPDAGKGHRRVT